MADKIDQIKIGSTSYDIDLPPDATPSITGLTVTDSGGIVVKASGSSNVIAGFGADYYGSETIYQANHSNPIVAGGDYAIIDSLDDDYNSNINLTTKTLRLSDDADTGYWIQFSAEEKIIEWSNGTVNYTWGFPNNGGTILAAPNPIDNKNKYLHTNASTGALEWSIVSSTDTNYYATSNFNSSNGTKIATGYSSGTASTTYDLYAPNATTTQKGVVEIMTDAEMDAQTGGTSPDVAVNPIVDLVYPVGAIYISTTDSTVAAVQSRFVGTTWVKIQGRFLLGAGSNTANTTTTYGSLSAGAINRTTIGEQGGEVSHTLTTSEMPSHSHNIRFNSSNTVDLAGDNSAGSGGTWRGVATGQGWSNLTLTNTGSGSAHNNMPPYYVVYMYRRTA